MNNKIIEELIKFNKERDFDRFHTPENLAKSISIEAAELLEVYQWGNEWNNGVNVEEEVADVLIYSLLLCNKLGLNPEEIILNKIEKNKTKHKTGKEKLNEKR